MNGLNKITFASREHFLIRLILINSNDIHHHVDGCISNKILVLHIRNDDDDDHDDYDDDRVLNKELKTVKTF